MFTKPIDEITFEDVESFCKESGENVRVEYKSDITVKRHIPKIVSSFANTYGGLFLIGVKADKTKNEVIFPIQGIPQRNGIEEQIQQSALTGIYPGVIPEIKLIDVPNSENVVVIVRVDESIQAPHAIEGSTKVYIRTGSITQPYRLSDIDRISHMLKRREDSQGVAQQIFDRIEERSSKIEPTFIKIGNYKHRSDYLSKFTVIARPVFPYRPVITASNIYELYQQYRWNLIRVTGGVFTFSEDAYWELNEYGIVYYRTVLSSPDDQEIDYSQFIRCINNLIKWANTLYADCEYFGNLEVTAQLQNIFGKKLIDPENISYGENITADLQGNQPCYDSEVLALKQCLARDLEGNKEHKDLVEELTCQLLWAFNIPVDKSRSREKLRKRIEWELS